MGAANCPPRPKLTQWRESHLAKLIVPNELLDHSGGGHCDPTDKPQGPRGCALGPLLFMSAVSAYQNNIQSFKETKGFEISIHFPSQSADRLENVGKIYWKTFVPSLSSGRKFYWVSASNVAV